MLLSETAVIQPVNETAAFGGLGAGKLQPLADGTNKRPDGY
jgi:hypothetical protein